MARKTRDVNKSRLEGTRTTISVSDDVRKCLARLTDYLESAVTKSTGTKPGLIINDAILWLINFADIKKVLFFDAEKVVLNLDSKLAQIKVGEC